MDVTYQTDAISKNIATASAKLGSVPQIAALDFVALLNLSDQSNLLK